MLQRRPRMPTARPLTLLRGLLRRPDATSSALLPAAGHSNTDVCSYELRLLCTPAHATKPRTQESLRPQKHTCQLLSDGTSSLPDSSPSSEDHASPHMQAYQPSTAPCSSVSRSARHVSTLGSDPSGRSRQPAMAPYAMASMVGIAATPATCTGRSMKCTAGTASDLPHLQQYTNQRHACSSCANDGCLPQYQIPCIQAVEC